VLCGHVAPLLHVTPPANLDHLLTSNDAYPELAQVRVIIYLSLDDEFVFSSVESSLAAVAERLTQTNIRIGLHVFASSHRLLDRLGGRASRSQRLPRAESCSGIAFGMPRPDIVASTATPKWLSLFPLLKHVEFLDGPNDLSRKAKIPLLRCIVRIRSVKIDEETRDVASWLSIISVLCPVLAQM
jgi:hypothetical protein